MQAGPGTAPITLHSDCKASISWHSSMYVAETMSSHKPVGGPQAVEVNKVGAALARAQEVKEDCYDCHHRRLQAERMPLRSNASSLS